MFRRTARRAEAMGKKQDMSEQREPDQTEDPRGQDVGDGYPEVEPEGADPTDDDDAQDDNDA
jgi:hypothetical protein